MKNFLKILILPIAIITMLGGFASTVLAAPTDLEVEFQATPLFNEANFLPGSEVSRWTKVKNNTPGPKPIIVETINESDPEGLADVFEIGIYENGIQRYATTTLAAFFGAGEISLSDLAGGGAQWGDRGLTGLGHGAVRVTQERRVGDGVRTGAPRGEPVSADDSNPFAF